MANGLSYFPDRLRLTVINAGQPCSEHHCGIAEAANQKFNGKVTARVRVNRLVIRDEESGLIYSYNIPDAAIKYIRDHDVGRNVGPRSFTFLKIGSPRKIPVTKPRTPERQAQIQAAKKRREAEGRGDKKYMPNPRTLMALGRRLVELEAKA